MATRLSRATGNWLTAGTWETVDATSLVNSEAATGTVTTSYTASAGATTGVITATGIGLKLSVRTGTTGTLSVHLAIAGVEVVGTLVTVNTADFPVAASADLNGGWQFFEFASPVVLAGATSYTVEVKTSSASQIGLFSTSGTAWSHFISTSDATAPTTGDDVIIAGEYTGAGTSNSFTVTYDETASTDYGSAPTAANSLITPGLAVCNKGTLLVGTTGGTAYVMKMSNSIITYSGGTLSLASVATAMPRNSSFALTFDCGANVDYGLTVRNLGTYISQGLSRTAAKLVDRCLLNTDEAANSTSLGIDTDTGWLDNDEIAVASTTKTASQSEKGALNGAANAADITVDGFAGTAGGILNAHSGTSPTQAEVILLTRNVLVQGASATLQAYINIRATANVDCDWTEFKWMGSATAGKTGIDLATTTGTVTFDRCSFHDFKVASSNGLNLAGATGTGLTVTNCVFWDIYSNHFVNVASSGSWSVTNCVFILNAAASATRIIFLLDIGGTFTGNTIVSSAEAGILINGDNNNPFGTWGTITIHSCVGFGLWPNTNINGSISTMAIWRNTGVGVNFSNGPDFIINNLTAFGNGTANISTSFGGRLVLNSPVLSGDSTFATSTGISFSTNGGEAVINGGDLGTASGIKVAHSTADITIGGPFVRIILGNTKLASATEISGQTLLTPGSFISSEKHDQTAGLHKTFKRYGTILIETTTVHTGSQSIKMTPNNASFKLESSGAFGGFKVAVASGATVTPTVYVYEDAAYNGARARLIVKRNDALGITSDTVLATASASSDLAWEALSAATAAVTDDGTLEFVVDCDGTAGNLFVDSFTVA